MSSLSNFGNSFSSIYSTNLVSHSLSSVYMKVWQLVDLYTLDPYPEVALMAQDIYYEIRQRVSDNNSESSLSEPGSPNRQSYLSSDSFNKEKAPVPQPSGRRSVSALSSPYLANTNNPVNQKYTLKRTMFGKEPHPDDVLVPRPRTSSRNSRVDKSTSESINACRKPIVHTNFVDWCTKQFSQPCSHLLGVCDCTNMESPHQDYIASWRNDLLRQYYFKCKKQLSSANHSIDFKIAGSLSYSETRHFAFHPFDKSAIVCDKYNFSLWNYLDGTIQTHSNMNTDALASISDIQMINTHERALLMVACDDGSIKVWRDVFPYTFYNIHPEDVDTSFSPKLSTSFFIFEDMNKNTVKEKILILDWNQRKETLLAAGDNKFIRIWDAKQERKVRDIISASEVVTSICSDYDHLICAGCSEGVVRLFDDRNASNRPVISLNDSTGSIVKAHIWPESQSHCINIVTGNQSGDIRFYDKRFPKAVRHESMGSSITAMAFHQHTGVFAWLVFYCVFYFQMVQLFCFTVHTDLSLPIKYKCSHWTSLKGHHSSSKKGLQNLWLSILLR